MQHDTHAVTSLVENTRNQSANIRVNEISELFEYNHSRTGIQIGDRTLIEMPNKGNAKIFSGASEAEVKQYFMELTGSKNLPAERSISGKGNIYTVKTSKGTFNLRDFSASSSETGRAWTIDIPRNKKLKINQREKEYYPKKIKEYLYTIRLFTG
ncbi:hypothetical protein [Photorhabdus khanii]|uniref:hypothetical protein n=1 Tax=Photorhabdus khanii TaxID=1004150 RepID=UPI001EEF9F6A|nr:hypothetical protein [Photorhabdus khanii]